MSTRCTGMFIGGKFVRIINAPAGMKVTEKVDGQGKKTFEITFESEPLNAAMDAPIDERETVVAASQLNERQKRDVREEMRLWWNRKLLSLLPAPPWNEERRQFVLGYWPSLDPRAAEDELKAASDEIAALAAHSRLAALMRGETTNPPLAPRDP